METIVFAALLAGPLYPKLITLVAAGLAGFVAVQLGEKIEDKHRHALKIAEWGRENGLSWLPRLLESYAVGDKSGIVKQLAELYATFSDDDARAVAFDKIRRRQLEIGLADPAKREIIYQAVDARKILDAAETDAILAKAEAEKAAKK